MSDKYPPNSHNPPRALPTRTKQTAIVTNARIRKKSLAQRVAERGTGIWQDVLIEVIKPYVIDLFAETFHAATDQIWYGQSGSRSPYRGPRPGGRPAQHISAAGYVVTDYASQYQGPQTPTHDVRTKPFDFSVYAFTDYAAGREMIDRLNHIIHAYGHASVNDLYDLLSQPGDHVGENYGWDGLNAFATAEVKRVRGSGGYYLDIPDAKPLKK